MSVPGKDKTAKPTSKTTWDANQSSGNHDLDNERLLADENQSELKDSSGMVEDMIWELSINNTLDQMLDVKDDD